MSGNKKGCYNPPPLNLSHTKDSGIRYILWVYSAKNRELYFGQQKVRRKSCIASLVMSVVIGTLHDYKMCRIKLQLIETSYHTRQESNLEDKAHNAKALTTRLKCTVDGLLLQLKPTIVCS